MEAAEEGGGEGRHAALDTRKALSQPAVTLGEPVLGMAYPLHRGQIRSVTKGTTESLRELQQLSPEFRFGRSGVGRACV